MELECQLANILDNCEDMLLSKYYQQHGSSLEKSHFKTSARYDSRVFQKICK